MSSEKEGLNLHTHTHTPGPTDFSGLDHGNEVGSDILHIDKVAEMSLHVGPKAAPTNRELSSNADVWSGPLEGMRWPILCPNPPMSPSAYPFQSKLLSLVWGMP